MKIAIQGGKASFHDIAAHKYFGDSIETVPCNSFRKVCQLLQSNDVPFALMAIENSIAGSILANYSLIKEYNLKIVGEYKLRIKQNLMALKGQQIDEITRVRSHYMALLQCQEFLGQYGHIELEEYHDTADSAKDIAENSLKGVAAIAGDYAAELYDLEIIAGGIETIKQNYTRFFVLSTDSNFDLAKGEKNMATISFELKDKVGSLVEALQIIVEHNINLTKIQSVPIIGKPDKYTFYTDCTWDDYNSMLRCYVKLNKVIENIYVLGEYHNWKIEDDSITS